MNKKFCGNAKQRRVAKRRAVRTYMAQRAIMPSQSVFPEGFGPLELEYEEVCIHVSRQPYVRFQFSGNTVKMIR